MVTDELLNYIHQVLDQKIPDEEIRKILLAAGWQADDISQALTVIKRRRGSTAPTLSSKHMGPTIQVLSPIEKSAPQFASQILSKTAREKPGGRAVLITLLFLILLGGGGFAAYSYGLVPESWYGYLPSEWFAWLPFGAKVPAIAPLPPPAATSTVPLDETANWKTYRNEQYGFEIKHPPDFKETVTEESNTFSFHSSIQQFGSPAQIIRITIAQGEKSLEAYRAKLDEKYSRGGEDSITVVKSDNIAIGGKNALNRELSALSAYSVIETLIDNTPTQIVHVEVLSSISGIDSRSLNDQILSTFKFIEPISLKDSCEQSGGKYNACPLNPPPNAGLCLPCQCPEGSSWSFTKNTCIADTSTWKTYRSEKYEFEVKYPPQSISVIETTNGAKIQNKDFDRISAALTVIEGYRNYRWESPITRATFNFNSDKGKYVYLDPFNNPYEPHFGVASDGSDIYLLESGDAGYFTREYATPNSDADIVIVLKFSGGGESTQEYYAAEKEFGGIIGNIVRTIQFLKK